MAQVSPLAEILANSMRQTCTIYRYGGADPTGQPVYSSGTSWPCRIAIKTERSINDMGDYITNSTVSLVLPANCDIGAYDMVDLPDCERCWMERLEESSYGTENKRQQKATN